MISVVIATIDRADALRDISIPSLLRQNEGSFEVIVWDASDNTASQTVCESFLESFRSKNIQLKYHKAPRKGSASQRNDAAAAAAGDIVFFIDDDCELSLDAIAALRVCFDSFCWLYGAGISLLNKTPASGNSALLKFAARLFGMKNSQLLRLINGSGGLSLPIKDLPGPAEWLSGGSMAFRKAVFEKVRLDERLERFGGHALGEDVDFSHRIMLAFGQPLMIASGGYIVHHASSGGARSSGINKIAACFFNPWLIRNNFKKYGKKFNWFRCLWSTIGTILDLMRNGNSIASIKKGYDLAKEASRKVNGGDKRSI